MGRVADHEQPAAVPDRHVAEVVGAVAGELELAGRDQGSAAGPASSASSPTSQACHCAVGRRGPFVGVDRRPRGVDEPHHVAVGCRGARRRTPAGRRRSATPRRARSAASGVSPGDRRRSSSARRSARPALPGRSIRRSPRAHPVGPHEQVTAPTGSRPRARPRRCSGCSSTPTTRAPYRTSTPRRAASSASSAARSARRQGQRRRAVGQGCAQGDRAEDPTGAADHLVASATGSRSARSRSPAAPAPRARAPRWAPGSGRTPAASSSGGRASSTTLSIAHRLQGQRRGRAGHAAAHDQSAAWRYPFVTESVLSDYRIIRYSKGSAR